MQITSRAVCWPEAVDELSELTLSGHTWELVRTAAQEAENLIVFCFFLLLRPVRATLGSP